MRASLSAPLPSRAPPGGLPGGAPSASLAAAALLGAAIAGRSPALIALALVPLGLVALARPDGMIVVFATAFYLNLPVLAARDFHLSPALSSLFALLPLVPALAEIALRRRPLVVTPALALMVGYLVILVMSATLSAGGRPATVGPITTFLEEGLLLYLLVTNVVRTPRGLRAVVWSVVLAGAFMGMVSVWQEATHAYHTTLGGLAQVDATGFNVGSGATGKDLRPRLAGPIGEKNRYAQVLLVLLPLAISRVSAERRRGLRLLAAVCAGLIVCGVALTFSRGAAIAMALLLVAMAVLRMISVRRLVALVVALVVLVAVVAPDYATRLQTLGAANSALSQSSTADAAIQGRATESIAAFHVFRDHFVLGVGPGQFFSRYSAQYGNALDLRFLDQNRRAHNLYLEIAADTGALGLAAFLAIVGMTMAQLRRLSVLQRTRDPALASLAQALLLALVAYLATGLFLQLAYQRYFWFLVALANAAVWICEREQLCDTST
jgi:putative inorganic carbon (HCO3(-)) transporter